MNEDKANKILREILESIELPDSAYERAKERYEGIGKWLHREESTCSSLSPHVFPSGSLRLGTANKPEGDDEAFDLDMACELQDGVTKESHTQKELKLLVGDELELYRQAKGIKKELEEKRRCWTLEYADTLSFHMDIVPCIPESDVERVVLREAMVANSKLDNNLAEKVASLAVSITDNDDDQYPVISNYWRISNPEGYAKWFEMRMKLAETFLVERQLKIAASIDQLPYYRWKTPLQSAIQLLKRHRDTMFKDNSDSKPISIIITTLASHVYQGESDLVAALKNILNGMDEHLNSFKPRVPNPVNPAEDFADKWYSPDHAKYQLEENFGMWLRQVRADFRALLLGDDPALIVEAAKNGFAVSLDKTDITSILGVGLLTTAPVQTIRASNAKPWANKK